MMQTTNLVIFFIYVIVKVKSYNYLCRPMKIKGIMFLLVSLFFALACSDAGVKEYRLEVVAEYPHDTESYTQGLFFQDGEMYESTGQYGLSTFRKVDLTTGQALKRLDFSDEYFVEGSVMFEGNLYVLTWTSRKAFIYDAATLEYKSTWSYPREGWGLTHDGKHLIASDGSATLYFMDSNFAQQKKIRVTLDGRPVRFLNELEYIDGRIWANVYTTDSIVMINPKDGKVTGMIDCTDLLPRGLWTSSTDVLNGIAYDDKSGKIYLTGKNWPRLYEVRIVEKK